MRQGEREPLATTAAGGVGILVSRTLVQLLTLVLARLLVTVLLGERWLPTVDLILAGSPGILLSANTIPAMVGLALSQGRPGLAVAAGAVLNATLPAANANAR
jgi:hypothetical protein